MTTLVEAMAKRSCLVTGANAGIGWAAALQLAQAGHRVLLGCRDEARGVEAMERIRAQVPDADLSLLQVDMSLQSSVRAAAAKVGALDVLIHNAAWFDVRARTRTETAEGVEMAWATNHLGPALLTELLMPRLLEGPDARVLAVSSKGLALQPWLSVSLDDPEFQQRPFTPARAYYQSKLAHLAWMLHEAHRWRGKRVLFHGVRVTNVRIDLARYPGLAWYLRAAYAVKSMFSMTPAEMARTYTWLATDESLHSVTGGYWDGIGRVAVPNRWAADPRKQEALDAHTRRQLGLG
ncbi:MAG: hypothetical protein RL653_1441 [Pseudomonadota bacterium]